MSIKSLLCCAKATADVVGDLMSLIPDSAADKDVQLLQVIDQHFNNPAVKNKDWARLHTLYHDAILRIARRLNADSNDASQAHGNDVSVNQAAQAVQAVCTTVAGVLADASVPKQN